MTPEWKVKLAREAAEIAFKGGGFNVRAVALRAIDLTLEHAAEIAESHKISPNGDAPRFFSEGPSVVVQEIAAAIRERKGK